MGRERITSSYTREEGTFCREDGYGTYDTKGRRGAWYYLYQVIQAILGKVEDIKIDERRVGLGKVSVNSFETQKFKSFVLFCFGRS